MGERAGSRGLDELQGPVEIGLADAIGAEKDRQPVDGKKDGAQRSITRGMNLSHHQRHATPRVSFLGSANASRHATDKHAAIPYALGDSSLPAGCFHNESTVRQLHKGTLSLLPWSAASAGN